MSPENFEGTESALARVEKGVEAIRSGHFVLLTDDEDRENEGDLVLAAQFATPESINFMAAKGRGLICLAMEAELIDRLSLPPMVQSNESSLGTAFTVSIGARHGITTGISAFDRAHTVQTALKEGARREDLVVPGHVFPLRARPGGVLVRAGHTEGSVDLARLAGLRPAAVICEVLKEDGSMARRSDLLIFAKEHGIPLLSIEDLILYRLHQDASLVRQTGVLRRLDIKGVPVEVRAFRSLLGQKEHDFETLVWLVGDPQSWASTPCLVRVQSEAGVEEFVEQVVTGAPHPLHRALKRLVDFGQGVLVSLPGGPGEGEDGVLRRYGLGAQILRAVGVRRMHLLTDHPKRLVGLTGFGLEQLSSMGFEES